MIMKKLSESRLNRVENLAEQRINERTVTLDLNDDELRLLMSASKSSGLDVTRLVTRLVKSWLNNEQRAVK